MATANREVSNSTSYNNRVYENLDYILNLPPLSPLSSLTPLAQQLPPVAPREPQCVAALGDPRSRLSNQTSAVLNHAEHHRRGREQSRDSIVDEDGKLDLLSKYRGTTLSNAEKKAQRRGQRNSHEMWVPPGLAKSRSQDKMMSANNNNNNNNNHKSVEKAHRQTSCYSVTSSTSSNPSAYMQLSRVSKAVIERRGTVERRREGGYRRSFSNDSGLLTVNRERVKSHDAHDYHKDRPQSNGKLECISESSGLFKGVSLELCQQNGESSYSNGDVRTPEERKRFAIAMYSSPERNSCYATEEDAAAVDFVPNGVNASNPSHENPTTGGGRAQTEVAVGENRKLAKKELKKQNGVDKDTDEDKKDQVKTVKLRKKRQKGRKKTLSLERKNMDVEQFRAMGLQAIAGRQMTQDFLAVHPGDIMEGLSSYKVGTNWSKGVNIGKGAFSCCYRCRDNRTGRCMAVKQITISTDKKEAKKTADSVQQEVLLLRMLQHDNILTILGVVEENRKYNIFTEWCPGGTLTDQLNTYGVLSDDLIRLYLRQLLDGVDYIHGKGIIHRDLKGVNLLIDSVGQKLKIADFGSAGILRKDDTLNGEFANEMIGTVAYMAPEALRGEHYGRSVDIWGIGCVIVEMGSGNRPWFAENLTNHIQLMFKIAKYLQPPDYPENITPVLRDLCDKCFATDPKCRPSARVLLNHEFFDA